MSEENVELAHRAYDAISRRDLDAFLALMDPEVVAIPRILAVEGGALHGHDGVRKWWESMFSGFPDFDTEVIGVRAVGDLTISEVRAHGRGEGSEAPFEDAIWVVSHVRDGKVVRWQTCASEADALEAAGLEVSENADVLRRALDAFNRRDRAAWLALCDPELENIPPREWPEAEPSRGPEAVWDFYVEGFEPWEEGALAHAELIEAGNDMVASHLHGEVRGKASGAAVAWSFWQVVRFRNGRLLRIEWFADRSEALEALGLRD